MQQIKKFKIEVDAAKKLINDARWRFLIKNAPRLLKVLSYAIIALSIVIAIVAIVMAVNETKSPHTIYLPLLAILGFLLLAWKLVVKKNKPHLKVAWKASQEYKLQVPTVRSFLSGMFTVNPENEANTKQVLDMLIAWYKQDPLTTLTVLFLLRQIGVEVKKEMHKTNTSTIVGFSLNGRTQLFGS